FSQYFLNIFQYFIEEKKTLQAFSWFIRIKKNQEKFSYKYKKFVDKVMKEVYPKFNLSYKNMR
ncbi:MAG: hypothetical protein LBG90_07670, partial [Spirochaetaceae bacterium]|nr:hypothetical protein [Spirochaetaceae bacterium]